jgi:LPXTG-motif cell wall-anchored protein
MRDAQNVLEIESVTAGPHSLVLLAKNRANEIIDRKAIRFSSTASAAASSTTGAATDTVAGASSADGAWARTDKPAATTVTTDVSSARDAQAATPPERATPMIAQAPPPPAPRHETQPRTLPETSTSDPSLALAGAGLLLAGFLVRRLAG